MTTAREAALEKAAHKARAALEAMMHLYGPDVAGLSLMAINELDRALSPAPAQTDSDTYLIWSNEHGAWWRPNAAGYTMRIEEAGRYSREEAISHSRVRDQHRDRPLPEIAIAERDVIACLVEPPA